MHIRRFEAASVREAIEKVKDALGPDALVLSTRTLSRAGGPFGMLSRPRVEVTAAVDRDARRGQETAAAGPAAGQARAAGAVDPSWRGLQLSKALVDPLEGELRELRRAVQGLAAERREGGPAPELERSLAQVRRVTEDLARRFLPGGAEPVGSRLCGRLLAAGLAPRHAYPLGQEAARCAVSPDADDAVLVDALGRRLDAVLRPPRADDPRPVRLLVGPTGVGKTTTLAKLAAREREAGAPVAVVTTDTYRIGAEEQLRTLAGLLDVPFAVAHTPEELARRVEALPDAHLLVDTAGRSRRDPVPLAELCRLRERLGERGRVELVLAANAKDADLRGELERHAPLRPDALVVTKLDETRGSGNIVNLVLDEDAPPLTWLGTGQRVPDDLALADPRELAAWTLEGVA